MREPGSQALRLSGERILLRSPSAFDAASMLRYQVENRAHLQPVSPMRQESFFTIEFWKRKIELLQEARSNGSIVLLLICKTDQMGEEAIIGQCSLSNISRGPFQAAYLGYSLDKNCLGRGYMSDALALVIRFAFGPLHLHRIMANYMPSNLRSAAVLKKLGFEIEGRARDYLRIDGQWEDHVLTALRNPNW